VFSIGLVAKSLMLAGIHSYHIHSQQPTLLSQLPGSSFSIYCTSNLDTTGACNRVDNNQPVSCEMVPGGVINCKQPDELSIQCVIYSGVIGTQAYFFCTRRTDPGVRDNRINTQRFAPTTTTTPSPSKDPATVITPLSDPLGKSPDSANDFTNSINETFN
jgi:hypothetical protein